MARNARLSTTTIKGTALRHPDAVDVGTEGVIGDRCFFVVDEESRLLSITRTGAFSDVLADFDPVADRLSLQVAGAPACIKEVRCGAALTADFYGERLVPGRTVQGPFSAWLSEQVGEPVRLVRADAPGGGIDVAPVTLLGAGSVRATGEQLGVELDSRRFRMTIDLDCEDPFAEDGWAGSVLCGEQLRLQVGQPTPRCAAVMRDPTTGMSDQPVLKGIRRQRGVHRTAEGPAVCLGVYAHVLTPGRLRVGEPLRLER